MNRALIICIITFLVTIETNAQQQCGRNCGSGKCCIEYLNGIVNVCLPLRKQGLLCGSSHMCGCEEGLECEPLFFLLKTCQKRTATTTLAPDGETKSVENKGNDSKVKDATKS